MCGYGTRPFSHRRTVFGSTPSRAATSPSRSRTRSRAWRSNSFTVATSQNTRTTRPYQKTSLEVPQLESRSPPAWASLSSAVPRHRGTRTSSTRAGGNPYAQVGPALSPAQFEEVKILVDHLAERSSLPPAERDQLAALQADLQQTVREDRRRAAGAARLAAAPS